MAKETEPQKYRKLLIVFKSHGNYCKDSILIIDPDPYCIFGIDTNVSI